MLDRGTMVGDYRIEGLLGRGGMGSVFRARDVESGRVVALKLMANAAGADPVRELRFRGEGRTQALLEHPHVVTVYDAGESEHGWYLAMRLVDGPSLADLIRGHELDARRAIDLLDQVADALDAAHAVGLVHRDVKPHNVLVGEGDHAFLADFGLTRGGEEPSLTVTGQLVGTVAYLAPEVVRGGEATAAADRYAFAAMAFECLTGTVVFPRSSNASVLFAHANDPAPRIGARRPELGDALDSLFDGALAKDPAERPATARELINGIRRELERSGSVDLPAPSLVGAAALRQPVLETDTVVPSVPPLVAQPKGRWRTLGLAAVGGAAVVAAAWVVVGHDDPAPSRPVAVDRPGLTYVGSELNGPPGRALDCNGRPPGPSSPSCTVVQSALPGATVVVPRNGVIRNWQVRGARGELTLVVTRPRDGGSFQVTASDTETFGSADVQSFDTDLDVERGDLVGLRVTPGSGVGVRDGINGATTQRWLPALAGPSRKPDRTAGTGFDHELLLRVGLLPGGKPRSPAQVTGSAAETLPAGRVLRRQSFRIDSGRLDFALVKLGDRFVIDEFTGRRRIARVDVPGIHPRAQITTFLALPWSDTDGGVDLGYVNEDSARVILRGYEASADGFVLVR